MAIRDTSWPSRNPPYLQKIKSVIHERDLRLTAFLLQEGQDEIANLLYSFLRAERDGLRPTKLEGVTFPNKGETIFISQAYDKRYFGQSLDLLARCLERFETEVEYPNLSAPAQALVDEIREFLE